MGEDNKNLPLVLITDDNVQVVELLKRFFEKAKERGDLNCNVIDAAHGAKAIELILKETPDIVLCDIHMPGKDGFEVLDDFNSICKDQIPFCYFAFLTGDQEERARAFQSGAMGFISKTEINYFVFTLQIKTWLRLVELERAEEIRKLELL